MPDNKVNIEELPDIDETGNVLSEKEISALPDIDEPAEKKKPEISPRPNISKGIGAAYEKISQLKLPSPSPSEAAEIEQPLPMFGEKDGVYTQPAFEPNYAAQYETAQQKLLGAHEGLEGAKKREFEYRHSVYEDLRKKSKDILPAAEKEYQAKKSEAEAATADLKKNINKDIEPVLGEFKNYTMKSETWDVPDPIKIEEFARQKAKEKGLAEDGYYKKFIYNTLKSEIAHKIIEPDVKKERDKIFSEKYGDKPENIIQKEFISGFERAEKIKTTAEEELRAVASEYKISAKKETETLAMQAQEQAAQLNSAYQQQSANAQTQEDLTAINNDYTAQFSELQKNFLNAQNQINTKYNSQIRRRADEIEVVAGKKFKEESEKYQKEFKISPELQKDLKESTEEAYKRVAEGREVAKQAIDEFYGWQNPLSNFQRTFVTSLGGSLKGLSSTTGFDYGIAVGDYLENIYQPGSAELKEWSDLLNLTKVMKSSGQLAGSMAPTLIASSATALATQGLGAPVAVSLLATGLSGWVAESADMAGRMYEETFTETGNAEQAMQRSKELWDSQIALMPAYAFEGLPFLGKSIRLAKKLPLRIAVGGAIETGTEFLQEYPQNLFEEAIKQDKPFMEGLKNISAEGAKRTLLNIAPVALLGGAGQARAQKSEKEIIADEAKTFALKTKFSGIASDQRDQFMFDMLQQKGGTFSFAYVNSLYTSGNIDKSQADNLIKAIGVSQEVMNKAKQYSFSDQQQRIFASFMFKYNEAKSLFESETEPISKKIAEIRMKEIEDITTKFATGEQADYVVMTYPNNEQYILTHNQAESIIGTKYFADALLNEEIKLDVFGENKNIANTLKQIQEAPEIERKAKEQAKQQAQEQLIKGATEEVGKHIESEAEKLKTISPPVAEAEVKTEAAQLKAEEHGQEKKQEGKEKGNVLIPAPSSAKAEKGAEKAPETAGEKKEYAPEERAQFEKENAEAKEMGFRSAPHAISSINKAKGTEYKTYAEIPKEELKKYAGERTQTQRTAWSEQNAERLSELVEQTQNEEELNKLIDAEIETEKKQPKVGTKNYKEGKNQIIGRTKTKTIPTGVGEKKYNADDIAVAKMLEGKDFKGWLNNYNEKVGKAEMFGGARSKRDISIETIKQKSKNYEKIFGYLGGNVRGATGTDRPGYGQAGAEGGAATPGKTAEPTTEYESGEGRGGTESGKEFVTSQIQEPSDNEKEFNKKQQELFDPNKEKENFPQEIKTTLGRVQVKSNHSKFRYRLKQLAKGVISNAETKFKAFRQINLYSAGLKVESIDDAAFIFRALEHEDTENVFALHVREDGTFVAQHLSTGIRTSTTLSPLQILDGIKKFKTKRLFIVHNHPSGNLNASEEDKTMWRKFKSAMPEGVVLEQGIIINLDSGKFSVFDAARPVEIVKEHLTTESKIPVKTLTFSQRKLYVPQSSWNKIKNSNDVAEYLSNQKRGVDKTQIIILNNANKITGVYFARNSEIKKLADEIGELVSLHSGTDAIISSSTQIKPADLRQLQEILYAKDIPLLDYLTIRPMDGIVANYISEADEGMLADKEQLNKRLLFEKESPYEAAKRKVREKSQKPSEKEFATGVFRTGTEQKATAEGRLKPVEFPELVQLAKAIAEGVVPLVKELGLKLGYFAPSLKHIVIAKELFKREHYEDLLKTIAHEIGHFIDFIPHETMKRGNILGRIASLKDFMEHFLPLKPGAEGKLTEEDIARFKKIAKETSKDTIIEKEVDEEIEKTIGITPQDILDVWNTIEAGANNPQLLDFIKNLSAAEKKSIVKEAMKGKIPESLKNFITTIKEKTGRKITIKEIIKGDWKAKLKALVEEEIRKRQLWQLKEIYNEAYALSKWWRPYDEATADKGTKEYRKSSKEIYADMISILFNSPGTLQEKAPKFFSAFMNYLENKPDFKKLYEDLMENLNNPDFVYEERRKNIIAGFKEAAKINKEQGEITKNNETLTDKFKRQFLSVFYPVLDKIAHSPLQSNLSKRDAVRDILEQMEMWQGRTTVLLAEYKEKIIDPLQKAGIDMESFGLLVKLMRNISPTRIDLANPLGMQGEKINLEQMDREMKRYDETQQKIIEEALNSFYETNFDIMQDAYDAGLVSPELWQTVQQNKYGYAAFQAVEHMDGDLIKAKFYKAGGGLGEIANPLFSTLVKMAQIQKAAARNRAALVTYDVLQEFAPNEIEDARFTEGGHVIAPKEDNMATIFFKRSGKTFAVHVDNQVAKIFEQTDHETMNAAMQGLMLASGIFKDSVTKYDIGFSAFSNPIRDSRISVNHIITILNSIGRTKDWFNYVKIPLFEYPKTFITSFGEAHKAAGKKLTPITKEMLQHGAFNPKSGLYEDYDKRYTTMRNVLRQSDYMQEYLPDSERGKDMKALEIFLRTAFEPFHDAIKSLRFIYDKTIVRHIGKPLEMASKIAGYRILKERLGNEKAAAYYTRNFIGTPPYHERTGAQKWYSWIPFAKVIIQGLRNELHLAFRKPTAGAYWIQKGLYTVLPAGLTGLAYFGVFDDDDEPEENRLSALMKKPGRWLLTHYNVFVLGQPDSKGKVANVHIPVENGSSQVIHSLIVNSFMDMPAEDRAQAFLKDIKSAFPEPWSQPLQVMSAWYDYYVNDINPMDNFYGRNIIRQKNFKAGGSPALKDLATWTIGTYGYKLPYWDRSQETTGEKLLAASPLRKIYSETAIGDYEKLKSELAQYSKEEQKKSNELDEKIAKVLEVRIKEYMNKVNERDPHAPQQKAKLINRWTEEIFKLEGVGLDKDEKEKLHKQIRNKISILLDNNLEQHTNAMMLLNNLSSTDQQIKLLHTYEDMTSETEFRMFLKYAMDYKLLTKDATEKAKKEYRMR